MRWWVELDIKAIKTTLKMDILRCQTPEMVRKEIWVHLLSYNLIRKIMAQAAIAHNKKPRVIKRRLKAFPRMQKMRCLYHINKAA